MVNEDTVMTNQILRIKSSLKNHAYHFVFGVSIASLAALLLWWSIFIHNSIQQQMDHFYNELDSDLKYLSLILGMKKSHPPESGILREDERFEVTICKPESGRYSRPLKPFWPDYCIKPRSAVLQQIEERSQSLNLMLIGEAGFLIVIILVSIAFLYRHIRLERRTAQEIKVFWERSAHEIKTPITGIKAFLQNLKSRSYNIEELPRYVDMALKQVRKQEQLAENILSGYQLESKNTQLDLVDLNLVEFLTDYFTKDALHLTGATVKLNFKRNEEILARADAHGLKVIMDNITDNAVKYGPADLVLSIDVIQERRMAVVLIKDNGPGFPSHLRNNLFRAYKHLDDELPTKRRGTGMGLYISQLLAKRMGGDLKATSEGVGQGAEFQIIIHLVEADAT